MKKYNIAMVLFPGLTIQDFAGPYEVFIRAACFEVFIVSENTQFLKAEGGLTLKADLSFDECPACDILFVPGGPGITSLLTNKVYHAFLQKQAAQAQYITSVCTGSLLLAAAGILQGYKATTHWRALELLQMFGIETAEERVVTDRNRITGGGITAGIDFGLTLTGIIGGDDAGKIVQLLLEYDPLPPYQSGSPQRAEQHILRKAYEMSQPLFELRKKVIGEIVNG